ncbi:MAG: tetratricopeptide repeat protein, partial [Chitinophagaceae bacterium]
MSRLLLLLLLLISGQQLHAQSADELKAQLKNTKDSVEIGKIISHQGNDAYSKGDFVAATSYFFASLRIAERHGDRATVAANYNNLSATYTETENYPEAEAYAQKAISLYRQLGGHLELANAYNSLANVYYMQEKDSLSLRYFNLSLAQRKIIKDSIGLFKGYKNLGALHFEMADTAAGIRYLQEGIRYITGPSAGALWFSAYLSLAQIAVRIGDLATARSYFEKAQP